MDSWFRNNKNRSNNHLYSILLHWMGLGQYLVGSKFVFGANYSCHVRHNLISSKSFKTSQFHYIDSIDISRIWWEDKAYNETAASIFVEIGWYVSVVLASHFKSKRHSLCQRLHDALENHSHVPNCSDFFHTLRTLFILFQIVTSFVWHCELNLKVLVRFITLLFYPIQSEAYTNKKRKSHIIRSTILTYVCFLFFPLQLLFHFIFLLRAIRSSFSNELRFCCCCCCYYTRSINNSTEFIL